MIPLERFSQVRCIAFTVLERSSLALDKPLLFWTLA